MHDVDVLRIQADADDGADAVVIRGLDQPFEALELHDDVVVQTLEGDAGDGAYQMALICGNNVDVLRADDHVHRLVGVKARVHAVKDPAKEPDLVIGQHDAVQDVAFADKVRHEGVFRLIIDILRPADLLDAAFVHDHHSVRHGEGFLLVVGDIDEGDAGGALDALQLVLHVLAQSQVQRRQGFVQQQHLGLVHQRPGNGHPLLLAAGEGINAAVFVAAQADNFQHFIHPAVNFVLGQLGHLQSEGDVVVHIQVREQGVALEHGVDLPLVRGQVVDDLAVEGHRAGCRR